MAWLDDLKGKTVQSGGTSLPQRKKLNLLSGFTVVDNPATESTDITAFGSGGATSAVNAGDGAIAPTSVLQNFFVTLNANAVIHVPTSTLPKGTIVRFIFKQDATAYRSVSWDAGYLSVGRFLPRQGPAQASEVFFVSNGDGTYSLDSFDGIDVYRPARIVDWGADPAGVNDSTTAIQKCLDWAQANSTASVSKSVDFGTGYYLVSHTISVLNTKGLELFGAGRESCVLRWAQGAGAGAFAQGPMLFFGGDYGAGAGLTALPMTTALATGTGAAMVLDGTANYYVLLSDNFNVTKWMTSGLTQLCVEFYCNLQDPSANGILTACGGASPLNPAGFDYGFYVQVLHNATPGTCDLSWGMTTGGVVRSGIFQISLDVTHHVAMTYDGSTVRVYVDGVLKGSQAGTGTVTSSLYQHCVVGAMPQKWPNLTMNTGSAKGSIDSVRISKTARYTSDFTPPTAKFSYDANTIVLHNFDNEQANGLSQFYVNSGGSQAKAWSPVRRPNNQGSGQNLTLRDMHFSGQSQGGAAIHLVSHVNSIMQRLSVDECAVAYQLESNSYGGRFEDVFASASDGLAAIIVGAASAAGSVKNLNVVGYRHVTAGVPIDVKDALIQPNTTSINSFMMLADAQGAPATSDSVATLENINIDDEGAANGTYVSSVHAQSMTLLVLRGGNIDIGGGGNGAVPILADHCLTISCFGVAFGGGSLTPGIVKPLRSNTNPVQMFGCQRFKTVAPWTTDAGLAPVNTTGSF
jgi:hypothetical protein